MKEHINFYENLKEAQMRLNRSVVMYDGEPHTVVAITNHKTDKIFRTYLWPCGATQQGTKTFYWPSGIENYPSEAKELGEYLDKWLELPENKDTPLIRKMMNSPKFNKFRPFPLGMINYGKSSFFLERQPVRRTEQGLTRNMIRMTSCSLDEKAGGGRWDVNLDSQQFRDCVLGNYPSAQECLTNLLNPDIDNTSAAFHRQFALIRGPLNLIFVSYKGETVGMLPYKNTTTLLLDSSFGHVKEAIEELGLFGSIQQG